VSEAGRDISCAIKKYHFNEASDILYHFTWHTFCDWYVECVKPVLIDKKNPNLKETQSTISWVLNQILIIAHPLIPFVTEELWMSLGSTKKNMLINEKWPNFSQLIIDGADKEMDWVIELVSKIRSIRSEINISPKNELKIEVNFPNRKSDFFIYLQKNESLVKRLGKIKEINIVTNENHESGSTRNQKQVSKSIIFLVKGVTFIVKLDGIIDLQKEKKRLIKEADKLKKDVILFAKKLDNKNFLAKANPLVIEETKEKLNLAKKSEYKILEFIKSIES
jgi:valyl-tRNA synthetase